MFLSLEYAVNSVKQSVIIESIPLLVTLIPEITIVVFFKNVWVELVMKSNNTNAKRSVLVCRGKRFGIKNDRN